MECRKNQNTEYGKKPSVGSVQLSAEIMRQKEHKRKAKTAPEPWQRIGDLSCKDISE
jgi:hypothetical protein